MIEPILVMIPKREGHRHAIPRNEQDYDSRDRFGKVILYHRNGHWLGELTFANTLLLSNAAISLGIAFISLEISSQFHIFISLFSFILAFTFISLQIKEFRILGLSINDSVYSCLFFFLTGLHFFHLLVGLLLCCLLFWSSSYLLAKGLTYISCFLVPQTLGSPKKH